MIRFLHYIFPENLRLKKLNDLLKARKKKATIFEFNNLNNWNSNDTKALLYLCVFFIIWFTFEARILCWINNVFTFNIFVGYQHRGFSFTLVILIFLFISIKKIPKKLEKKYFIPYRHLFIPFSLITLYFVYRVKGEFSVAFNYFGISLLDLIIVLAAFYFFIISFFTITQNNNYLLNNSHHSKKFYYDDPIELDNYDTLGFRESVNEFYLTLINTIKNNHKSLSVGIIGFWGEGKSSYIKLLMNKFKLKHESFIVIEFNPRYSKSLNNIQQEFFQILFEELKEYDLRFSSKFLDYLKAINVFESKNIFNFFKEGHDFLFDREDEKQKINQAIERINKKIVVFIDDLDRLIDDEVMEVIKLIHYNAALSNVIFITAYDKNYISQILQKYNHGSGLFTDKFFTIEKSLPFIPRESYSSFIIDELTNNTNYKEIEVDNELIAKHCKSNFSSLRDCKRFLNYFIDEYNNKKGSVDFTDFYLLSIIRFKWNEVYQDIRDSNIVRVVSLADKVVYNEQNKHNTTNSIILSENFEKFYNYELSYNLILLLRDLFEKDMNERSLNNNYVFDNYFIPYVNSYSNPFALESMFNKDINENITFINEIFDNKQGSYLIHYLFKKRLNSFKKETFENFIDILLNTFCKTNYNYDLSVTITKLLLKDTSKEMFTYRIFESEEIYKTFLNDKISKLESGFYINYLSTILKDSYRKRTDKNLLIFSSENILDIIKENFKKYCEENKYFNEIHLKFLYSCLSEINYESNEYGEFILDKECCEISKEMIGTNPDFYLGNFVKKLMETSDPDWNKIGCEPLYIQIFGSNQNFEDFISDKEFNGNNYINKIRNFWIIFKHNNYQAVEYRHRGNIDNIIDGNFQHEVDLLKSNMDFIKKM